MRVHVGEHLVDVDRPVGDVALTDADHEAIIVHALGERKGEMVGDNDGNAERRHRTVETLRGR